MVMEDSEIDSRDVEIRNRFQVRDQQIEHIAWALKAEMESGYPSGRIYVDGLATALAARLIRDHSSVAAAPISASGGMPGRKLKELLSFIEDNLSRNLGLRELAQVAGLSTSHLNVLFRQSVGMPVHQYVIRRRVERAATLLRDGDMSIGEVALEAGFSHQSHMASHMRRVLGISPKKLKSGRLLGWSHR
jgi:AraC family transcriptional regulator